MKSDFTTIKIIEQENIAYLILNRPKKLNALSQKCLKELVLAAQWFNQQKHIQVVIFKGAGRAFSAGADLQDSVGNLAQVNNWVERREIGQIGFKMTQAISSMEAITIAQVHGFAIGGAFLLMLACDFRIAAQNTFFSIPEVDLGIPLAWGGIPKLVNEIGPLKTKELVMTCRRFDAAEAVKLGLLNRVVQLAELEPHCLILAKNLASKPSLPLRITKEQVNAVTKHIGSAYPGTMEGDMLQSIMKDAESKAAAVAYVAAMTQKKT